MSIVRSLICRLLQRSTPSRRPAPAARWYPRAAAAAAAAAGVSIGSAIAWFCEEIRDMYYSLEFCDEEFLARALPEDHRDTVRARRVAANIIVAARDDEVFGQRRLSERTGHRHRLFHRINWRVHVIDDDNLRAYCYCTGEIVMHTGILSFCPKDADVATVLAHEVAHVIARHHAEYLWKSFLVSVLAYFVAELLDSPVDAIRRDQWEFLMRPCRFRGELEADRVGLLLQAAAGYDPRASPWFYETLWTSLHGPREHTSSAAVAAEEEESLDSTHPPICRRAAMLRRERVMGEAMKVFSEAVERRVCASGFHPNCSEPTYSNY